VLFPNLKIAYPTPERWTKISDTARLVHLSSTLLHGLYSNTFPSFQELLSSNKFQASKLMWKWQFFKYNLIFKHVSFTTENYIVTDMMWQFKTNHHHHNVFRYNDVVQRYASHEWHCTRMSCSIGKRCVHWQNFISHLQYQPLHIRCILHERVMLHSMSFMFMCPCIVNQCQ